MRVSGGDFHGHAITAILIDSGAAIDIFDNCIEGKICPCQSLTIIRMGTKFMSVLSFHGFAFVGSRGSCSEEEDKNEKNQ